MTRFIKISSDNLKLAYTTLGGINKDLVEIMKKLGYETRSVYLHKEVTDMQGFLLRELGERTLIDTNTEVKA